MTMTIKSARVQQLVRETATLTHESLTETVGKAVEERLIRLRGRRTAPSKLDAIMAISKRCAALPDIDMRTADDILDYDGQGAPHGH
jgi:antitoxin VapB